MVDFFFFFRGFVGFLIGLGVFVVLKSVGGSLGYCFRIIFYIFGR